MEEPPQVALADAQIVCDDVHGIGRQAERGGVDHLQAGVWLARGPEAIGDGAFEHTRGFGHTGGGREAIVQGPRGSGAPQVFEGDDAPREVGRRHLEHGPGRAERELRHDDATGANELPVYFLSRAHHVHVEPAAHGRSEASHEPCFGPRDGHTRRLVGVLA